MDNEKAAGNCTSGFYYYQFNTNYRLNPKYFTAL